MIFATYINTDDDRTIRLGIKVPSNIDFKDSTAFAAGIEYVLQNLSDHHSRKRVIDALKKNSAIEYLDNE